MMRRWIKRAAIFFAIIAALLIGFLLFLHTAAGKTMVRKKVQSYLQQKWNTEVLIGNIDYRLPNWIALEEVIVLDHKKDTLLSGGRLYVGIKLLKLLSNTVDVSGISLENINLLCRREAADSVFNFQFVLDAFAPSTREEPSEPEGAPMVLSVKELTLNKVWLHFSDQREQLYFSAFITDLSCFPASLHPETSEFRFHDFELRNTRVIMADSSTHYLPSNENTKNKGDPAPLLFALNKLQLDNVFFSYEETLSKTKYSFQVDSLLLRQATADIGGQHIKAESIRLSHAAVNLLTWAPVHNSNEKTEQPTATAGPDEWKFYVDTITLRDNSFVHHNAAVPAIKGLDFQHINAQSISLQTHKNTFDSAGMFSDLEALSLVFNDQFHVKQVRAHVRVTDSMIHVKDLATAINQTQLTTLGDMVWRFKPGSHLASTPHFAIENLSFCYGDLLLIQPALKNQLPITLPLSEKIQLSGNFSGNLQHLKAEQVSLAAGGKQIQLKGSADFSVDKASPEISLTLYQLQLQKRLLAKEILQQFREENIHLPEEISLTGKVLVNAKGLVTAVKLNSAFGQLQVNASVANFRNLQQLAYNITLDADHFETGKWIGLDSQFGKITGRIFIRGKGIHWNKMAARAQLQLQSAVINNYPYTNIALQAGLNRSEFTVQSSILDPSLETALDLNGHLSPDLFVQGAVRVRRADLFKLGFAKDSFVYAGNLSVEATYGQPNRMHAFVRADSNQVFIRGRQIKTDSLLLTCKADTDTMLIAITAPFINAQLAGNYPIHALSSEIASMGRTLYPLDYPAPEKRNTPDVTHHRTSLDIHLRQDSLLRALLPGLEVNQPVTVVGRYSTEQKDSLMTIRVMVPQTRYGRYEGRDLLIAANVVDSVMHFSLTGRTLLIGKNRLTAPHISGHIQKGLLSVKARVNDSTGKEYYSANVRVEKEKDEMAIRFLDDLTLNRNKWKVSPDNLIRVVKQGYIINHLLLENRGQAIAVSTKDQQTVSPINIRIDSFDISHIFTLLSHGDTLGAKGIVNANIRVQQPLADVPIVTGDMNATNLSVLDIPIGNLRFQSNSSGDSLAFHGGLSGANQMGFNGHVHLTNRGLQVQTRLEKININMIQALAKDVIGGLSGNITGDFQVAGTLDAPKYAGIIHLDSVLFSIKALNTVYRLDKQKLVIESPALHFEKFVLTDSAGHPFTLKGNVGLFSASEKKLDINIETKDFMILNASRKQGASLYGTGIMDAQLTMRGTIDEPIIEGNVYLHKQSQVHFVSGPKSKVMNSRKGGIMFVKIDTLSSLQSEKVNAINDSTVSNSSFKGLKYDLSLKVDKDAEFSVVMDPTTSDELVLKGEARLKAGLGENGEIGLEGVYNLRSGYYKMNNLLLRGKFLLVKGSSISFGGDPALAEADVTTEYEIEATPKGLLTYKDDDAAYSQRVPFAVIFMIKGHISKPVLSFDIRLKEGKVVLKSSIKSDIEHALDRLRSDVTEMNKQVFSLLLTKRFSVTTGTNTLESSNLNANNALKEGVSSFLTEAMNQVADQLIKNVDVDVNMKTYKTNDDPISKTDLGVAVSKDLLEDRLVIRIEENFTMGNTSAPVKSGSQYIPDITSTYKLSKDGRFLLKAYQKNEYDAVVQGYFTEVGVNFTIELSYDKFRELLERRKSMANEKK
jgi:translocation and assembly module TamB